VHKEHEPQEATCNASVCLPDAAIFTATQILNKPETSYLTPAAADLGAYAALRPET
jgi:hypothetical protein